MTNVAIEVIAATVIEAIVVIAAAAAVTTIAVRTQTADGAARRRI